MLRLKQLKGVLLLVVLVCGFNCRAEAQTDCGSGYKIYVRDEAGNAIRNGKLEVKGLSFPLPGNATSYVDGEAVYNIVGEMGATIKGDFLFKISAEGFEPYERRFNFPVCEYQRFELRLQPKGSSAKAHYERLFILHGKVFDEEKRPLGHVKVEAKTADGRIYQTFSNQYGYYEIGLPRGVANIRVSDSRFPPRVFIFKLETNYSVLNVPVCLKCDRI